jgi:Sporulation protein Cse60
MPTKVKLFQNILSVSPGVDLKAEFTLEKEINAFLSENPGIKLVDIKLSGSAAPVGERSSNYGLYALVIYEQA